MSPGVARAPVPPLPAPGASGGGALPPFGHLPRQAQAAAGGAWERLEACERETVGAWRRLVAPSLPDLPATRGRRAALAREAEALVGGTGSMLGQAARAARRRGSPWDVGAPPLSGAVARCGSCAVRCRELADLLERIRALLDRHDALHATFAAALPNEWRRRIEAGGLSRAAIERIGSIPMAELIARRLAGAEQALGRWRDDIRAWLARERRVGAAGGSPAVGEAAEVEGAIERRYEYVLRLQAVDGTAQAQRIVDQLRRNIGHHLRRLTDDAASASGLSWWHLALGYAEPREGARISVDELLAYESVLGRYSVRAVEPTTPEASSRVDRYATAIDRLLVVIRTGTATPLAVPVGDADSDTARLVVQVPAISGREAMTHHEFTTLLPMFHRPGGSDFWWKAQPAWIRRLPLDDAREIGECIEFGRLLPKGADPTRRPTGPDAQGVFGVFARPQLVRENVTPPWGPRPVRAAHETACPPYDAPALIARRAEFPGFSHEPVWLWVSRGGRPSDQRGSLRSAAAALLELAAVRPGGVAQVLHYGSLDEDATFGGERVGGDYVATRIPVSVRIGEILRAAGSDRLPDRATIVWDLLGDLAVTLERAHALPSPCYLGALTPGLLRCRPALIKVAGPNARPRIRVGVRSVLVMLPPVVPGTPAAAAAEWCDESDRALVRRQAEACDGLPSASPARDLCGLGYLLEDLLRLADVAPPRLREIATELQSGRHDSAKAFLRYLSAEGDRSAEYEFEHRTSGNINGYDERALP